jgi:hypothetical protein
MYSAGILSFVFVFIFPSNTEQLDLLSETRRYYERFMTRAVLVDLVLIAMVLWVLISPHAMREHP